MTDERKITLYDAQSALKEKTLFVFPFRLRLFLDYKKIPYETIWIDFADIEVTAKAVGAPPTTINADGNPGYTLPFITITFKDQPTLVLSGAAIIAAYIEDTIQLKGPSLLPKETRVFQAVFTKYLTDRVLSSVFATSLDRIAGQMGSERTQKQFMESRKRIVGKSWDELVPKDGPGREKAWRRFDAAFDDLAALLDKAGEGNYRVTGGVSYSELELVSILNVLRRTSPDEAWKRLEARNGGRWAKLLDLPEYRSLLPANRVGAVL